MRISVDDNKVYEIFRLEIKFVEISGWGRLIGKGWCNVPPLGTLNLKVTNLIDRWSHGIQTRSKKTLEQP